MPSCWDIFWVNPSILLTEKCTKVSLILGRICVVKLLMIVSAATLELYAVSRCLDPSFLKLRYFETSYFLLISPPSLTHSLTHSLAHSLTNSLTHWLIHSLGHSLTHSLAHSLTHSLTGSLTHWLTLYVSCSFTPSQPFLHSLCPSLYLVLQPRRISSHL